MPKASLFANAAGGNLLHFSSQLSLVVAQPSARVMGTGWILPHKWDGSSAALLSQRWGWIPKTCLTTSTLHRAKSGVGVTTSALHRTQSGVGVTAESLHVSVGGLQDLPTLSKCLFSCSQPALSKMEAPGLRDVPRTMLYQGTTRDSDPTHTPLLGLSLYQMISLWD